MSIEEDVRTMANEVEEGVSEVGEAPTKGDTAVSGAPDGRAWRIACGVLAALLVGALVGCLLLWQDRSDLEERAEAERAATEEAERIVVAWLTYDYRTYRDDMAWVTDSGTESFQEDYSPEALEGLRKRMIGPRQLVSRGRAVNSAATVQDADHVTVLVFTDQTLTDKEIRREGGEALHARSGVELSMVREDGEWLVDEMVQLQFQ